MIHRLAEQEYPAAHGFKLTVPDHLYNLGELHNLRVSRGTDRTTYRVQGLRA